MCNCHIVALVGTLITTNKSLLGVLPLYKDKATSKDKMHLLASTKAATIRTITSILCAIFPQGVATI